MYLENSLKIKKCLQVKCYLTLVIIENNAKNTEHFSNSKFFLYYFYQDLIHFHINQGIMVIFQKC